MKFVSYRTSASATPRVGLLSDDETVTPLSLPDGSPIHKLEHLVAKWDQVHSSLIHGQDVHPLKEVEILAPLRERDILCVGKNYKDHAIEFANSGYDTNDKQVQPEFPVIFTKRATSITAHGKPINAHIGTTDSVDYEGELAIIVGKGGRRIPKEKAWEYVWGATIINDVTARDRQRDHKQFYIGKSLDTFCPMGPYVVQASQLDFNNMTLTTKVNGEVRQQAKTTDLIFDIPTLIETCSNGITLRAGDVISTGTPAGVAVATGNFLKAGDVVEVSIAGLGTLSNTVAAEGEVAEYEDVDSV